ncbi:hypothetical protein CBOM_07960 [Ceraceosorus bombacis]|uniref:Uncharacterized protein n=1 Tax=Ceraceosorus bombacis TaxID=401625 RepID=A0A0P1BSY3_9BASI|nr:hypothetical protein CBOM_07960 [Ceraceosorus bombacis]
MQYRTVRTPVPSASENRALPLLAVSPPQYPPSRAIRSVLSNFYSPSLTASTLCRPHPPLELDAKEDAGIAWLPLQARADLRER